MVNREDIIKKIINERQKQESLPGAEYDLKREPNDWLSIAGFYLFNSATRKNQPITEEEFEDCLVKAASIIVAALEHKDYMKREKKLK